MNSNSFNHNGDIKSLITKKQNQSFKEPSAVKFPPNNSVIDMELLSDRHETIDVSKSEIKMKTINEKKVQTNESSTDLYDNDLKHNQVNFFKFFYFLEIY